MPTADTLTQQQIDIVIALERIGAALSIFGVSLIFISYWAFKRLRTVPNLFILFASLANVGASIACAIGYDGLRIGETSALCQTQAFLLEMFMQSDPWWSFAMAVNVYLVFFAGANPSSFRKYLWVYCVVCFGFPLVPAVCCLVIRPDGPDDYIYGDATLWCWIGAKWSALRIYTYYIPIWCCIFGSTVIYFAVGYHVFHQRNQFLNLTFSNPARVSKDPLGSDGRVSIEKNQTARTNFYATAVTEVQITSMSPRPWTPPQEPSAGSPTTVENKQARHQRSWRTSDEQDDPPCSSRFKTTCSSSPSPPEPPRSIFQRVGSVSDKFSTRLKSLDPIKLAYLRTSFIFAISVLVTWTPSSINRVFNLVKPHEVSFGLNVASATVLPLQGVWNAVIFFTTSWATFKEEWQDMRHRQQASRLGNQGDSRLGGRNIKVLRSEHQDPFNSGRHGHNKAIGSDQTSEFELMSPPLVGNIRAMRGSFSV